MEHEKVEFFFALVKDYNELKNEVDRNESSVQKNLILMDKAIKKIAMHLGIESSANAEIPMQSIVESLNNCKLNK